MGKYKEMTIIVTDDDDGHAELIVEGLRTSGVANPLIRFCNGEELWRFLSGQSVAGQTYVPTHSYLLLLDINMPRMDGVEVLSRMKNDERFRDIPVMMLTTTDDPREVERCYRLGCNMYITKPVDFTQFAETLHRLGLFLQVVRT
jgi:CheY-like chemotaxis protein